MRSMLVLRVLGRERMHRRDRLGAQTLQWILVLSTCAVVVGCSTTQHVRYDLRMVRRAKQQPAPLALDVAVLVDKRRADKQSALLFREIRNGDAVDEGGCLNLEEHYERGEVPAQVTEMIRAHFQRRGAIRSVTVGRPNRADYRLTGTIRALYGAQEVSTAAIAGQQFGLLGALATSNVSTDGHVRVVLSQLMLRDAVGRQVATIPEIVVDYRGALPADAHCWRIYSSVNERLAAAVAQLASRVEAALQEQPPRGLVDAGRDPAPVAGSRPRTPPPGQLEPSAAPGVTPAPRPANGTACDYDAQCNSPKVCESGYCTSLRGGS